MSDAAIVLGVLVGVAGVVLADLASSEIRGRLDRIPHRLIQLAARRLDERSRADSAAEWTAELRAVLRQHGADAIPLARLVIGIRFALGIVRAARTIDRDLQSAVAAPPHPADTAGLLAAWAEAARTATSLRSVAPPLVTDLVDAELARISTFMSQLQTGCATYLGEDQDWLMALACSTRSSLDATSLSTADRTGLRFDRTFWTSDIAQRYLLSQREIITRGVAVRRLFVLDRPELAGDPDLIRLCRQQTQLGIQVRLLVPSAVPPDHAGTVTDFIIFDRVLAYETLGPRWPTDDGCEPATRTQLWLDPAQIADRVRLFQDLWHASAPAPAPPS